MHVQPQFTLGFCAALHTKTWTFSALEAVTEETMKEKGRESGREEENRMAYTAVLVSADTPYLHIYCFHRNQLL